MIDSEKSLKEILNDLLEKSGNLDGPEDKKELERLKSEPEFRRLVEVLLEEGQRRDKEGRKSEVVSRESGVGGRRAELKAESLKLKAQGLEGERQRGKEKSINSKPIRNLAVIYSKEHKHHYSDQFKMESPDRVEAILTTLKSEGFLRATKTTLLNARKATIEELQSVHDLKYIEFIRDTSRKGITSLPRSTYICPGTWDAALYAAGGALMAEEIVGGQRPETQNSKLKIYTTLFLC